MKTAQMDRATGLRNTEDYLAEVTNGGWLLAENGASEVDDGKLCRGCIVSYPKGELAVVMSCQEGRLALLLPISAYHSPACDQEILLPESRYVVCTWDARYQRLSTLKNGWVIEMLGKKDFALLFAHYKSVHSQCGFPQAYSGLLGAALSALPDEKRERVLTSMSLQASRFDAMEFATAVDIEDFAGKATSLSRQVEFTLQTPFVDFTSMPNAATTEPEILKEDKKEKGE